MTEHEVAEINAAKEKLMKDSQALFGKMYESRQQAGAGRSGPGRRCRCCRRSSTYEMTML